MSLDVCWFHSIVLFYWTYTYNNKFVRNGGQKLLAILIAFGLATSSVLGPCITSKLNTRDAVLISIQFFVGSVIIIYLDEVPKKGYGLLSGVPLFTVANTWWGMHWRFLVLRVTFSVCFRLEREFATIRTLGIIFNWGIWGFVLLRCWMGKSTCLSCFSLNSIKLLYIKNLIKCALNFKKQFWILFM